MLADSLIVLGLATVSLGTIQETDGVQERSFWLQNVGEQAVTLVQGYTSCGCTTIDFPKDIPIAPRDSACVTLRFNPRGKGGEFEETGTIVYRPQVQNGSERRVVRLSLVGTCITSEETLLRQYPVVVTDDLRLSSNRFDLGPMTRGQQKTVSVAILHLNGEGQKPDIRRESIAVTFEADASLLTGIQHVVRYIIVAHQDSQVEIPITFDVLIR